MENNARCPKCNADFYAEYGEHTLQCPHCGAQTEAIRARKYFSVFHVKSTEREVHGKQYFQYDEYLRIGAHHLEKQEFDLAEEAYSSAIKMNPGDYRGHMGLVAVETKNYTDLKNVTHKQHLTRALAVADEEAQKSIAGIYKPYSVKADMTEEEYQTYLSEKQKDFKARVKKAIIGLAKKNDDDAKPAKTAFVCMFLLIGVGVTAIILSAIFTLWWLMIVGCLMAFSSYALLTVHQRHKYNQGLYEFLVALFNEIVNLGLDVTQTDEILDLTSAVLISVRDGDPVARTEEYVRELAEFALSNGGEKAKKCLKSHKITAKYVFRRLTR